MIRRSRLLVLFPLLILAASLSARAGSAQPLLGLGPVELSPGIRTDLETLPIVSPYVGFVHFAGGTSDGWGALLEDHGLEMIGDYEIVNAAYAFGTVGDFRALTHAPGVTLLEEDRTIQYYGDTAGWASRVRVAQEDVAGGPYRDATGRILDGAGIGIAVLDNGIDSTHPDLNVARNFKWVCGTPGLINATTERCFGPSARVEVTPGPSDTTSGHGTHVAGIAAGTGAASTGTYDDAGAPFTRGTFTGAAPGATLFGFGVGELDSLFAVAEALEFLFNQYDTFSPRIRVLNNSWGDGAGTAIKPNSVITQMVTRLVEERGVSVIFAAGNSGCGSGCGSVDRTSSYSKIATPGVVTVANYWDRWIPPAGQTTPAAGYYGNGHRNGALETSSSRGRNGSPATYPDISAPGTVIRSTCNPAFFVCSVGPYVSNPLIYTNEGYWEGSYASVSGTSMSAPHVAGIAALLYQAVPTLTPAQVEDVLLDSARKFNFTDGGAYQSDPQNPGGTTSFDKGAGLVDVPAALNALDVEHDPEEAADPPAVRINQPFDGEVFDGAGPITAGGSALDGTLPDTVPVTQIVASGDGGDFSGAGAADLVSLSALEKTNGIEYRIAVRDILDVPASGVELRVTQNVGGRPAVSAVLMTSTALEPLTGTTAPPTSAARDLLTNSVTFFVPFSAMGNPGAGTPAHNVFASSFIGGIVDVAPGPNPGAGADVVIRRMYGKPYTILRPTPVVRPTVSVRVSVDGGPERSAVVTGTGPGYTWQTPVEVEGLLDGTHTLLATLYLDGIARATHASTFVVQRPRVYEVLITEPAAGSTVLRAPTAIGGTAFTDDPVGVRSVEVSVDGPGVSSTTTATGVESWSGTFDFSSVVAGTYTIAAALTIDGVVKATDAISITVPAPPAVGVSCAPAGMGFWRKQLSSHHGAVFTPAEAAALAQRAVELSDGVFGSVDDLRTAIEASGSAGALARAKRAYATLVLNLAGGQLSRTMSAQVGLDGTEALDGSVYATGVIGTTVGAAATWVRAQIPDGDLGGANAIASSISNGIGVSC